MCINNTSLKHHFIGGNHDAYNIMAFSFSYPHNETKVSLTNAIVSEFPLLKNNIEGCKEYVSPKERYSTVFLTIHYYYYYYYSM